MAQQTDEQILQVLAEVVSEETGIEPAEVTAEKSFAGDLDIDSLSMMTILVNVEEKTGVAIPDEEMGNLNTVADAVSYIKNHQA